MRPWIAFVLAGCWSSHHPAPAREPIVQDPNVSYCDHVVELRGYPAAQIESTLAAKHLKRVTLIEHVLPVRDDPSDVVRTIRVDGRDMTGIVEIVNGSCVRNAAVFATDESGNIWKLEPPAGVVDYGGRRCDTDHGWVLCDLSGQVTRFFELPPTKTLAGVVNPDTGQVIEIPSDR
jgi:hypothetical protein